MRLLKASREPASGSSRPNRSPLKNARCSSWAWRGRRRRTHAWPRLSRMFAITRKQAAAGLNSAVHHLMRMRPACPYMHCTSPVCPRPMGRIEKAWPSCSRRNIPTGLGSSSRIPFQFSVTSRVDFPSAGTNGFPLREPVGRPWPLHRHCRTGRTSHKKAPETEKVFLFCVRWGKFPPRRGGVARQLNRSWRAGREARARAKRKRDSAQPQEKHEASIEARQNRENAGLTTPSAPLRWLRVIFLMAHPPLLCEEGNAPLLKHKSPKLRNATLGGGVRL